MTLDALATTPDTFPDEWVQPPESMRTAAANGEPTKMTYTADGRVFGHVCTWDTVLRDSTGEGWRVPQTIDVEAGMQGYAVTASGEQIKTGLILTDRNHTDVMLPLNAARSLWDPQDRMKPMENTGAQLAAVVYGVDEVGITASGWVLPGTTKTQLARARASAVSLECWPDPQQPSGYAFLGCQTVGVPGLPLPSAMPRAASVCLGRPHVAVTDSAGGGGSAPAAKSAPPKSKAVRIKKGDTLSQLAKTHGTTVKELMKANPQIKDANKIYAGKDLTLPSKTTKAPKPAPTPPASDSGVTTNTSGERRPKDNATGDTAPSSDAKPSEPSTPAPKGPSKNAQVREELKALTARTRQERQAINEAAAAEAKSSPGQSARIRADKSAKLLALREKVKAERDALRAKAKTAAIDDEGDAVGEVIVASAPQVAGCLYEIVPVGQFRPGDLVLVPGGRGRYEESMTSITGELLAEVTMISEDGVMDEEETIVPFTMLQPTGARLEYVDYEDGGIAMATPSPSRVINAAATLPDVPNPGPAVLQAMTERMDGIEDRLDMLEERANAGALDDPSLEATVAALADLPAVDEDEEAADAVIAGLRLSMVDEELALLR